LGSAGGGKAPFCLAPSALPPSATFRRSGGGWRKKGSGASRLPAAPRAQTFCTEFIELCPLCGFAAMCRRIWSRSSSRNGPRRSWHVHPRERGAPAGLGALPHEEAAQEVGGTGVPTVYQDSQPHLRPKGRGQLAQQPALGGAAAGTGRATAGAGRATAGTQGATGGAQGTAGTEARGVLRRLARRREPKRASPQQGSRDLGESGWPKVGEGWPGFCRRV